MAPAGAAPRHGLVRPACLAQLARSPLCPEAPAGAAWFVATYRPPARCGFGRKKWWYVAWRPGSVRQGLDSARAGCG